MLLVVAGVLRVRGTSPPGMTIGDVVPASGCKAACDQWDARRQERDNAQIAEASARAAHDSILTEFLVALAFAAALFAAAAVAANVPIAGPWLASALLGMAVIAAAIAAVLLGVLIATGDDLRNKANIAQDARDAEAQARGLVNANCSAEERKACYAAAYPLDPTVGYA